MIKYFLLFLSLSFISEKVQAQNRFLRLESDSIQSLLLYPQFAVSYDSIVLTPITTYHMVIPNQVKDSTGSPIKRKNHFFPDNRVKCASDKDYYKSGYDRGHMVPAGDFKWSQKEKDQSFVYTNIAPQNPALNRYVIAKIERWIREVVKTGNDTAYIITGCLYANDSIKSIGNERVGIPTHFYKVVFFSKSQKMFGFLIDNEPSYYSTDLQNFQTRVSDIEVLAKSDFFDLLPSELQYKLEHKIIKL